MSFNADFVLKFHKIVCDIYDYFVLFADTIINKTVLQSYASLTLAIQKVIGEPDTWFDLLQPLRVLITFMDYIVFTGIGNTPLASMPTIVFLLSFFITFSIGMAVLKIFK